MSLNLRLSLAAGALIVAACGDDGGSTEGNGDTRGNDAGSSGATANRDASTTKNDASSADAGSTTTQNPSTGGGKCGKGEYKYDDSELTLCAGPDIDDSCPAISELTGYTAFEGDLNLFPTQDGDLDGASCLETVGSLSIGQATELTSLKALSHVKSATGLEIIGMEKLTSLAGFDSLGQLMQLTINANEAITDIVGLPKGLKVGSLYIAGNPELTSLDGLIASQLEIENLISFENNVKLSSCKVAAFGKLYPNVELANTGNLSASCN